MAKVDLDLSTTIPTVQYGNIKASGAYREIDPEGDVESQVNLCNEAIVIMWNGLSDTMEKQLAKELGDMKKTKK